MPSRFDTLPIYPLMGCTYSRLGATLGSPKLRLLSLSSHFCPPFLLVLSLRSRKPILNLSLFPCVLLCAAPLSITRRPHPPSIPSPPCLLRTLRRSPFPQKTTP